MLTILCFGCDPGGLEMKSSLMEYFTNNKDSTVDRSLIEFSTHKTSDRIYYIIRDKVQSIIAIQNNDTINRNKNRYIIVDCGFNKKFDSNTDYPYYAMRVIEQMRAVWAINMENNFRDLSEEKADTPANISAQNSCSTYLGQLNQYQRIEEVSHINRHQKSLELRTFGILICRSGIGMDIAANRNRDIRAALCRDVKTAAIARQHVDANVLVLGSDFITSQGGAEIIDTFLHTPFFVDQERHVRRVRLLTEQGCSKNIATSL